MFRIFPPLDMFENVKYFLRIGYLKKVTGRILSEILRLMFRILYKMDSDSEYENFTISKDLQAFSFSLNVKFSNT